MVSRIETKVGIRIQWQSWNNGKARLRVAPRIVRIYTLRGFESVLAGSVQPGLLGDELA